MSIDLKDTLNLPVTKFPMRGDLVKREPNRLEYWKKLNLYDKIINKNKSNETFILHDGPPFTNGDLHLGHALNKTLKDSILRYKWMCGFNAPYIPGWDSHGLPIEYKVSKNLQEAGKSNYSVIEVRNECKKFAKKYKDIQSDQFQRLGILADWANEYWTIDSNYESEELKVFSKFIKKNLIYRSKKPIYWSVPCSTALAEAEIEYRNHKSISIYVKFEISKEHLCKFNTSEASFIIWTTTPWTLPANLGITLNSEIIYVLIKTDIGNFIIAEERIPQTIQDCSIKNYEIIQKFKGNELEGIHTHHPFIERKGSVLLDGYVSTESGTGCVHTAPGHGLDDYLTGLKYDLEIYSPISDNGCYIDDKKIPKDLVGKSVLENRGEMSEANRAVLKICTQNNSLLAKKRIEHSYPHCWRSKTPVIFRAMDQWFISLDKDDIKNQVIDTLSKVSFIPSWGQKRMIAAVQNRPDWCISRQRSWGVPIPAFFDKDGNAFIDSFVTEKIAEKISKNGADYWFNNDASEILDGIKCPKNWPKKDLLSPGKDTLDVWIDSGCSHKAVLEKRNNLRSPADLYLEGSDQHRGWFQSSLWTSGITNNKAPFKEILTHGFIVKEDGTKLSKSDGAARPLEEWVNKYGADIIRLWICSQDYRGDVPVSDKIVQNVANSYRTIRNTLRFLIGNLHDFDHTKDSVDINCLTNLDKWALNELNCLIKDVTDAYDRYEFHRAFKDFIDPYCSNTLSATYHAILKDRLYTLMPNDYSRRSSQTTLKIILENFIKLIAPILPFTADEAYAYLQNENELDHKPIALETWPTYNPKWQFTEIAKDINGLLKFLNNKLNEKLEDLRQKKIIGQSLDAEVSIKGPSKNEEIMLLIKYQPELEELFILSKVNVIIDDNINDIELDVKHAEGEKCPRSWRWVENLESTTNWGYVSPRCKEVHNKLYKS